MLHRESIFWTLSKRADSFLQRILSPYLINQKKLLCGKATRVHLGKELLKLLPPLRFVLREGGTINFLLL